MRALLGAERARNRVTLQDNSGFPLVMHRDEFPAPCFVVTLEASVLIKLPLLHTDTTDVHHKASCLSVMLEPRRANQIPQALSAHSQGLSMIPFVLMRADRGGVA